MDWLSERHLAGAVLDSLTASICILDREGTIVAVNESWRRFARENRAEGTFAGVNYIHICDQATGDGSEYAHLTAEAIRGALGGNLERFEVEYPCHGGDECRWFLARVTPLLQEAADGTPHIVGAVISHQNITDRKLLELKLRQLAETDDLTGAANRRKFIEASDEILRTVQRADTSAGLIMLDIDHFKAVNDTYGHSAGDEVLRVVADRLKGQLRRVDTLARIGGEEFAILLPGTDEWGALMLADRLRRRVMSCPIVFQDRKIPVTVSSGVAEYRIGDRSVDEALSRADKALYTAKEAGRNRVRGSAYSTQSEVA